MLSRKDFIDLRCKKNMGIFRDILDIRHIHEARVAATYATLREDATSFTQAAQEVSDLISADADPTAVDLAISRGQLSASMVEGSFREYAQVTSPKTREYLRTTERVDLLRVQDLRQLREKVLAIFPYARTTD